MTSGGITQEISRVSMRIEAFRPGRRPTPSPAVSENGPARVRQLWVSRRAPLPVGNEKYGLVVSSQEQECNLMTP